ncbi:hypothetical protein [Streptomyces caeruleatus]|uniref:Uncharacterized protein n=1 Tax=Streptomyces caeruleatus TaxID=661399 RepID=A0A101TNE7_9ACTN|nr:hypothetical protein [Streptomyces caeruleatus]KUN95395.1 hypothetical protein AQJ67_35995 [Streptomyces caeruleatus]
MGRKRQRAEEPDETDEGRSPLAGAFVLAVLGGVLVAVAFAIDEAVGVLLVVVGGFVALYRSARRMSDSSAPPPPPLSGDVYAAHSDEIDRIQEGPGEGLTILYPKPVEEQ